MKVRNACLVLIVVTADGDCIIFFVGFKLRFGDDKQGEEYHILTQPYPSILSYVKGAPHLLLAMGWAGPAYQKPSLVHQIMGLAYMREQNYYAMIS